MTSRLRRGRLLGWATVGALGAAGAIAVPAVAMSTGGVLSPRLAELAKPSVRLEPPARQAAMLSVASIGPGSLQREGGRILVDVRYERGAASATEALRAAGARIVSVSRPLQTVTVAAAPASLRAVAAVRGCTWSHGGTGPDRLRSRRVGYRLILLRQL